VLLLDFVMRKGGEWEEGCEAESTWASMESRRDLLMKSSSVLWDGDTGGEWRFVRGASVGYGSGVATVKKAVCSVYKED